MATPKTVLLALKALCVPVIYPDGEDNPSIINNEVIFRIGKPKPTSLDPELRDGKARVNFYPETTERNVSRFPYRTWEVASIAPATIILTVSNNAITISGTVTTDQKCVVIVNNDTDSAYVYAVQEGDTVDSIATNLAALIPDATAIGAVITIDNAYLIVAHMTTLGTSVRELKRQQRIMRITIRANNPDDRDIIGDAIDGYLAELPSFPLENDYSVTLTYKGSPFNDNLQKAALLQRDILFQCEYATIKTQTFWTIANSYAVTVRSHDIT